jgi:hypothetical protein
VCGVGAGESLSPGRALCRVPAIWHSAKFFIFLKKFASPSAHDLTLGIVFICFKKIALLSACDLAFGKVFIF